MSQKLEELATEITKLINEDQEASIIKTKFAVYEDLYSLIDRPSPKEKNDYICLYFKYLEFMGEGYWR